MWKRHKEPIFEQFKALPTETFCCIKPNRLPPLSPNRVAEIRRRLIDCDDGSAISKHSKRVGPSQSNRSALRGIQNTIHSSSHKLSDSCPNPHETFVRAILDNAKNSDVVSALGDIQFSLRDCCEKVYKTLNVSDKSFEILENTQNSCPKWKKARQFRIAGSRCYSVYSYSKNDWPEKARKYFWPKEFSTKETKHIWSSIRGPCEEKIHGVRKCLRPGMWTFSSGQGNVDGIFT